MKFKVLNTAGKRLSAFKAPAGLILKSPRAAAAGAMALCLAASCLAFGGESVVRAEAVNLSSEAITLYTGNLNSSTTLSARVYPENTTDKEIEWTSSDTSVATVDDGIVTAVSQGAAVISASSGDGEATAQCTVVVGKGVTGIYFEQEEVTLYAEGAPMLLSPVISPADATNQSLVWTSSDYNIVSVDSMGGIVPRSPGTAVIGASSLEGKVTAACTVHVIEAPALKITENPVDISAQRAMKSGTFINYLPIRRTLNEMLDIQCGFYNVIYSGSMASVAQNIDVANYVNPLNHCGDTERYQFLDLSVPNNLTAGDLNEYLRGKGILSGMGQAFIDAANENGISEAYLVAHACLETGNGTSTLSTGVSINGITVYNMFGIGAYDGNALPGGAAYAYSQGWTTPEAAIKGGARWIAQNYIYRKGSRQNTLYKMRWNPLSPGTHQYATDVGWAVKQASAIQKIIGKNECLQIFEIPAYAGTYSGYIPDLPPVGPPDTLAEQKETVLPDQAQPEQSQTEQTQPEQPQTQQLLTEQSPTEQSPTEQSQPEQPQTEQSQTEQPLTEQPQIEQAQSEQTQTEQTEEKLSQAEQTSSDVSLSEDKQLLTENAADESSEENTDIF